MDAYGVVHVDGTVDFGDKLTERGKAVRIAQLDFELVVEGLLVAVLPRATFLGAGNLDIAIHKDFSERNRVVLDAVVGVEYVRSWVVVEGSTQRLYHDDCAMRRRDVDAHDVSRVHIHYGRKVHHAAFPRDVREIGDPRVMWIRWCDTHEDVWIYDGLFPRFFPPPSSASVRFHAEQFHHALHFLFVELEMQRDATESVRRKLAERFFDPALEVPITSDFLSLVVQR